MLSLSGRASAVLLLAALLLLSFPRPGAAQNRDRQVIPCAEGLKLGAVGYIKRYLQIKKSTADTTVVEAGNPYESCKGEENLLRIVRLPAERRPQVTALAQSLQTLGAFSETSALISHTGGDTLTVVSAINTAIRPDAIAEMITLLEKPAVADPAARSKANAIFAGAARTLTALGRLKPPAGSGMAKVVTPAYQAERTANAQAALNRLKSVSAALPDAVALKVAQQMQRELTPPQFKPK